MFFIFGWGHLSKKEFDSGIERQCPQCHNHVRMTLLSLKKWFTVFFIPVIPYGPEYFLACPTCGHAVKLNKTQFDELRHRAAYASAGETYFGASAAGRAAQESSLGETFSAVTVCPNCSTEVRLSEYEVKARRYACPTCKTTVRWEPG
jgi:endogenous inhibitor of DNA gyrase (YacG/DUF329 family)